MPYRTVWDLPEAQVARYTRHQRQAFLEAFNHAYEHYDDDERTGRETNGLPEIVNRSSRRAQAPA